MKRILILGGYGVFGKRISERLAGTPDIKLIIAGRNQEKADQKAEELSSPHCAVSSMAIDALDISNSGLDRENIFLIINASGPYHKQDYRVAEYCIEHSIHYIDLADNRDFVIGITELDTKAKDQKVLITSGASTVPSISAMAIDHLAPHFSEIHELDYAAS